MDWGSLKPVQALAAKVFFEKRRLLLMLPRQEGKTELGVRLIHSLISQPGTQQALFLAKSHEALKKATREKFRRLFSPSQFTITTKSATNKINEDAICFFDSVDKEPDRIRGGTYQAIVWTEIAFSEFENGVSLFDVVQRILAPTMRKTRGFLYGESTPNGNNEWATLWNNAGEYGFHTLRVSLTDLCRMGLVNEKEYLEIKGTTHPTVFLQEYECEFVSFFGRIYDEFTDSHIENFDTPPHLIMVACGIDWGYVDATCLLAAFRIGKKIYVFDEIYMKKSLIEEFAEEFKARIHLWDAIGLACAADHDPNRIAELHRRGIPCGNAAKTDVLGNRIEIKELLWKNELVIHPRCKHLIMDLRSMEWNTKAKREDANYDKCSWGHYDAEAALRYLIRELARIEEVDTNIDLHFGGRDANNAWRVEAKNTDHFEQEF